MSSTMRRRSASAAPAGPELLRLVRTADSAAIRLAADADVEFANALHAALRAGTSEAALAGFAADPLRPERLPLLFLALERLTRAGLIERVLHDGPRTVATLEPCHEDVPSVPPPLESDRSVRLHTRALLFREGDDLVAETPLAPFRMRVHAESAARVLTGLARPITIREAYDVSGLSPEAATLLLRYLDAAGLVTSEIAAGDEAPLERHDLFFHARSRAGFTRAPYGAVASDPPPGALAAASWPEHLPRLALPRGGLGARSLDAPLAAVLRARRSVREHADGPLPLGTLAALLETLSVDPATGRRAYPSGGGVYALETYVVASRCGGLEAGCFHYDPHAHALTRVCDATRDVDALLDGAAAAWASSARPQALLVLAARFGRLTWRYRSIVYATLLKEVGAMMQTSYLAATPLGLAACALGGGDARRFARVTGIDPLVESSVGELAIGLAASPPPSGASHASEERHEPIE
jgi:oxazoline/thiazoline dehydrogenase